MRNLSQAVLVAAFFSIFALTVCAQQSDDDRKAAIRKEIADAAKPEAGKIVEFPTKKAGSSLIIHPAEIRGATWLWPDPSKTFKPTRFKGAVKGEVSSVVPLKDGGIVLAASDGGYIISKDGDVKVVGEGEHCEAVAVSPTGEIAFGFAHRLPLDYIPDIRKSSQVVYHKVREVHMVGGANPRTIVVAQKPYDVSFAQLAFNADGSVLMVVTYPAGVTLIKGDKVLNIPTSYYGGRIWPCLESSPKDAKQFLYCEFLFQLDSEKEGSFTRAYVGGYKAGAPDTGKGHTSSAYGSKGEVVSIKRNWKGNFTVCEGTEETEIPYRDGPRYLGADRLAVGEKFIAYTALDTVMVWDRKEKKTAHIFTQASYADGGYVQAIAFRPTGDLIVATNNGQVSEWDPETGKKVKTILQAR